MFEGPACGGQPEVVDNWTMFTTTPASLRKESVRAGSRPRPSLQHSSYLPSSHLAWTPNPSLHKISSLRAAETALSLQFLLCKPEDQNPRGKLTPVFSCVYTPITGEAEIVLVTLRENLFLEKIKSGQCLRKIPGGCTLAPTCIYLRTCT